MYNLISEGGRYKYVCLALEKTTKEKNWVVIKFPTTATTDTKKGSKLLYEYMMQHHAHTCTYHGMCTVPKPLGFIRFNYGDQRVFLLVTTFCGVAPGASVSFNLGRAMQKHLNSSPILTLIEWRNICKYLLEGFETLQRNDIYHNNVRFSNILLQFHENSVQPVIVGFANASRRESDKKPPETFYPRMDPRKTAHIAPELFQQPNPLPTSDLYGVLYVILNLSGHLKFARTAELMRSFRGLAPDKRPGFGVVKEQVLEQLHNDLSRLERTGHKRG